MPFDALDGLGCVADGCFHGCFNHIARLFRWIALLVLVGVCVANIWLQFLTAELAIGLVVVAIIWTLIEGFLAYRSYYRGKIGDEFWLDE